MKAEAQRVLAKYQVSDKTQEAREVWDLLRDGILQAHSIGFTSHAASPPAAEELRTRPDWAGARLLHRDWELLEFSVVGVPANPEALTLAVAKGYSTDLLRKLFGPDTPRPPRVLGPAEIRQLTSAGLRAKLGTLAPEAILQAAFNRAAGIVE